MRATVEMVSGAKVVVEGSDEDVVNVVARLERFRNGGRAARAATKVRPSTTKTKMTLPGLISEMISGGFFKEPRQLAVVKAALEQSGHFYPLTTLSPAMLRLVKARQLRRIKDGQGRWTYVS